jgi:hypothetical protein
LTDIILSVDRHHDQARRTAAAATRHLLDASVNFWERAWLKRSIERLEAP